MTHDRANLISADRPWMNTQAFLARLDEDLKKATAQTAAAVPPSGCHCNK